MTLDNVIEIDMKEQIDNLSIGDVDAIVVPAESKFTSMTQSTASIIRVTSNKSLLEDSRYQDAYIISDEIGISEDVSFRSNQRNFAWSLFLAQSQFH